MCLVSCLFCWEEIFEIELLIILSKDNPWSGKNYQNLHVILAAFKLPFLLPPSSLPPLGYPPYSLSPKGHSLPAPPIKTEKNLNMTALSLLTDLLCSLKQEKNVHLLGWLALTEGVGDMFLFLLSPLGNCFSNDKSRIAGTKELTNR